MICNIIATASPLQEREARCPLKISFTDWLKQLTLYCKNSAIHGNRHCAAAFCNINDTPLSMILPSLIPKPQIA